MLCRLGVATAPFEAWKAGTRHDGPLGLMRAVASRPSDAQAAVATFYATLPGAAPASQGAAR